MKKPYAKRGVPLLLSVLALVIAFGVSSAMIFDFDSDIGHFKLGSVSSVVLWSGVIVSALLCAWLGLSAKRKFSLTDFPETSLLTLFSSFLGGAMAVAVSFETLFFIIHFGADFLSKLKIISDFLLITLTVSLVTGCFRRTQASPVRIVFSLLSVVAVNLTMFACYFDFSLPLNSPVRNLVTIAQAGVLLLTLSEARLAISPKTRATSGFTIFVNSFAASAVLGISLGFLVFSFAIQTDYGFTLSPFRYSCYIAMGLLGLSRLSAIKECSGEYVPAPDCAADNDKNDNDEPDTNNDNR